MENLTNGQRLVGVNFNPSEDQRVAKIKQLSADLIDEVTSINKSSGLNCKRGGQSNHYSADVGC